MLKNFIIFALFISSSFGANSIRGGLPSATPGDDLCFQGNYLEYSVNPGGIFGNRDNSAKQCNLHNSQKLGVIVDYDLNGWTFGNPPKSGDAFTQGYNDVGFHVSFVGENGLEAFNNMPLLNDDDDGDTSYHPYRGCISCNKGVRADTCEPFDEDCSCNSYTTAPNYACPFKRWDLVTKSFTDASNTTYNSVVWVGVAKGAQFESSTSGAIKYTGEEITITKTIWSGINDTVIYEYVTIENTGTRVVSDVTLFWSIVPTLEAFPHTGFPKNASTDFANYFSSPLQGDSNTKSRTLALSRGQFYNMTVALGSVDASSRAWYKKADQWRVAQRPYTGAVALKESLPASSNEVFGEYAMGLISKVPTMNPGDVSVKKMFWAFHASGIEGAFENLTPIPITTAAITSAPITSAEITSAALTSAAITSSELTTEALTTAEVTTAGLTTAALSTGSATTTKPVVSTGAGTTGLAAQATSSDATSGAETVTTGDVMSGTSNTTNESPAINDDSKGNSNNDDVKIIAAIFGVAGFLLLMLAIGGVVLAVRRLKANPIN